MNGTRLPIGPRTLLAKTCRGCGLLLDARWFGKRRDRGGRGHLSRCVKCETAAKNARGRAPLTGERKRKASAQRDAAMHRYWQLTVERAVNSRKEWTDDDLQVLADSDLSLMEKALMLGRTYNAISVQTSARGYKSRIGLGDPHRLEWIIIQPPRPHP